jgi:putative flippase GtrA
MSEEIGLAAPRHASKAKLGRRNWIAKYVAVGASGAVLNNLVLHVLYQRLHMPLVAASAVAVELAAVNNYLLNDRWTFAAGSPSLRRFAKFNASSLGGMAVNVLTVWLLTRIGLYVLVANLAGIAAGMAVNITLSFTWVWRQRA